MSLPEDFTTENPEDTERPLQLRSGRPPAPMVALSASRGTGPAAAFYARLKEKKNQPSSPMLR